jgi:CheY-specific phosphatase CheX
MPERNLEQLIGEAVEAVLETMFFAAPLGPAEQETGPEVLEVRLAFRGTPSGTLRVRLSKSSARWLAAGFLGEDEDALTDAQPAHAVCELANMFCGSLVSRLESEQSFDLLPPMLVEAETWAGRSVVQRSFELDNGILTVGLQLEGAE